MKPHPRANISVLSGSILAEQIKLERQAVEGGVARYRKIVREAEQRGEAASLKPVERLLLHWWTPLVQTIELEHKAIRQGKSGTGRRVYGPYMLLLDAERTAAITLHNTMNACLAEPLGAPFTRTAYSIGRDVLAEINRDLLKKDRDTRDEWKKVENRLRRITPQVINHYAKKHLADPVWNRTVCASLGGALLWFLIESASVSDYGEEFELAFHIRKRRQANHLVLDHKATALIEEGHEVRQFLRPKYDPMIVPPYPWLENEQGGYVQIRTPFISKPTPDQKAAIREQAPHRVYECLNAISATPWQINRRILTVQRELWLRGGGALGIPHAEDHPLPVKPTDIDTCQAAKEAWKKDAANIHGKNARLKGAREEWLKRLGVAERFAGYDRIYFPHQLDFRGRFYPIPPYVNHQGDDVCRGLLRLARPRPVTDSGRRELMLHAANMWEHGVDKLPHSQQIEWVNANWTEIERSALDPLECEWWMGAEDKPWQFLAACIALIDDEAAAHAVTEIDGTCNGLQHYAALSRDSALARRVNLIDSESRADVYTDITEAVAGLVARAIREGDDIARIVEPHVVREVEKQPTMTTVYGVTIAGMTDQINRKLRDRGVERKDLRRQAASYLAQRTTEAMGDVCRGATEIMAWIRDCASEIAKAGRLVRWTSPIGLPVVQPYRRTSTTCVRTAGVEFSLALMLPTAPPKVGKHKQAAAPNYIHSVDASHAFETGLTAHRAGIDAAFRHDCYICHAEDMPNLRTIVREEFVRLHERPLLRELHQEWSERYGMTFPDPPPPGDWDLTDVLSARYAFT